MSENTLLLCTIAETWMRRSEKNDANSKSQMQSQFIDLTENEQTQECVSYGEEDTKVTLLEYQITSKAKQCRETCSCSFLLSA